MWKKIRFAFNRFLTALDRASAALERWADELEAEEPAPEHNGRPRAEVAKPARAK